MRALILGASAGLGRALGREMAALGHDLVLVSRDARDLDAEAAHLRLLHGISVQPIAADAGHPGTLLETLRTALVGDTAFDIVLCPIGASRPDDDGSLKLADADYLLAANCLTVTAVLAWLLPTLRRRNGACIVGFSSIAAARGRSGNVIYAMAKRGLESYFESLRHRMAGTPVRVQLYRLGYLDTQQSFGKTLGLPKADPARVARHVANRLGRDIGQATLPIYWRFILAVLRILPWPIFRRLRF